MVIYRVFTAVAKFIATEVRKLGILAIFYIDDILTLGKDTEECEKAVGRLLNILKARGFVINYKKSDLSPTKIFTYLGHVWNTDTMMVSLKPQREVKIRDTASSILNKKKVCGWKAAQFIGQVMSSLMAIPLARANIRKLQWRFIKTCPTYKEFNRSFLISEDIQKELEFWRDLEKGASLPIKKPRHVIQMATDASDKGYGIDLRGHVSLGKLPKHLRHINVKELWTLDKAINEHPVELSNTCVKWRTDNNTALAVVKNEGSTKCVDLSDLAVNILKKAKKRKLVIIPDRVPSEQNIVADCASRNKPVPDWKLNPSVVKKMFKLLGEPDIDLFATRDSAQVPAYLTWSAADVYARGVDALADATNWTQYRKPYAFPPFSLVMPTLEKCNRFKIREMILVVPFWASKPWFGLLLRMCKQMWRLPQMKNIVEDLSGGQVQTQHLRLVVCLISGIAMEDTTSPAQRLNWSNPRGGKAQKWTTPTSGKDGCDTVETVEFRNLRPLWAKR